MERMNHLKRVMAWVMTAAMLVSSCPTTAIADEVVSQVQKPVAQTSYCNVNLSSNEYKLLWESGRIFISVFLYGYIRIGASVNTGYIIYLSNKRTEEKINY